MVLNPKHLANIESECSYYRPLEKIRYAKGMIRMLESLPHKQMRSTIPDLMSYFSRRTYYRVRKGERLLSPNEQKKVLGIIRRHGALPYEEFDEYIADYDW